MVKGGVGHEQIIIRLIEFYIKNIETRQISQNGKIFFFNFF